MKLVYVHNKENGTTYVYESKYYWDDEKKQSRSKRVCIDKLDREGNLIPSSRFSRPLPETIARKQKPASAQPQRRLFFGVGWALGQLGRQLGLHETLRKCFPDCFRLLLLVLWFMVLEDDASLIHLEKWSVTHWHPAGTVISARTTEELFETLTEESARRFYALRGRGVPDQAAQVPCGQAFAEAVARIYLECAENRLTESGFSGDHMAARTLDRLDVIECYEGPDGSFQAGSISAEQKRLYLALGVTPHEAGEDVSPDALGIEVQ